MHKPKHSFKSLRIIRFIAAFGIAVTPFLCKATANSFPVYFTTNDAVLATEATAVLADIYNIYVVRPYSKITVSGHADTVGPPYHNLRLSKRRAYGVAAELINLGVDRSRITVKWHGETLLPYPTPNNFSEPYNRCVVINISD